MMKKLGRKIASLSEVDLGKKVTIYGWVRTLREQKSFSFVELYDGSQFSPLQVVIDSALPHYQELLSQLGTGASICATGTLNPSPAKGQAWELKAEKIQLIGSCPGEEYPLQKKRHSLEFLRTIAHLRPRTNTHGAIARVRSFLALATHRFFGERGFLYLHTPILTAADCEGGGEQFLVTTLDLNKVARPVDFANDFFERPTYLTVSGQLNAEAYACALSDIYTFGPTFRAEHSTTTRHLAEFWMIEPEMAFADLEDNIDLAEAYVRFLVTELLHHCQADLAFFNQFVESGLLDRLQHLATSSFARLDYSEAIEILKRSGRSFAFPIEWGADLQSEHERYLAEEHCKGPVFVTNYPRGIKAFYMRDNDDGKTVAAMDLLVPKIGEIIGGSQREERLDRLEKKVQEHHLHPDNYSWYFDLRRYGSVPHSGFGLGFERLIQTVTGVENIRDVIPFPRYLGHVDF